MQKIVLTLQLNIIHQRSFCNSLLGSICDNASIKFKTRISNPFCADPLNFVFKNNLTQQYDFEKTFSAPANAILDREQLSYREQTLLTNGIQTSGNLFLLEDEMVKIRL